MHKRIAILVLAAVLAGTFLTGKARAVASEYTAECLEEAEYLSPTLVLDEKALALHTMLVYDTTYVPLCETARALGASEASWDQETETASVKAEGLEMTVVYGRRYAEANERCLYLRDGCMLQDGKPFIPIRALCAAFGAEVEWDGPGLRVLITSTATPIESGSSFYNEDDLYWLSHIIYSEAGVETLNGQLAVGNVVLNRVAREGFPDTIKEVIFDNRFGIQFSPAYSGSIYKDPSEESIAAAKLCLEGVNVAGESLYFAPVKYAETCWAARNRPFFAQIDRQVFFT